MKIRDGEKGEEKVKIFPSTDVCCSILKRILAKFEAKGTKKKRKMNIRVSRAKRIEIEERKKKNTCGKYCLSKRREMKKQVLPRLSEIILLLWELNFSPKLEETKKKKRQNIILLLLDLSQKDRIKLTMEKIRKSERNREVNEWEGVL